MYITKKLLKVLQTFEMQCSCKFTRVLVSSVFAIFKIECWENCACAIHSVGGAGHFHLNTQNINDGELCMSINRQYCLINYKSVVSHSNPHIHIDRRIGFVENTLYQYLLI